MEGYMKALFIGIIILMVSTTACRNEILEISGTITDVNYLAEGSSFNAPDIRKTLGTILDLITGEAELADAREIVEDMTLSSSTAEPLIEGILVDDIRIDNNICLVEDPST